MQHSDFWSSGSSYQLVFPGLLAFCWRPLDLVQLSKPGASHWLLPSTCQTSFWFTLSLPNTSSLQPGVSPHHGLLFAMLLKAFLCSIPHLIPTLPSCWNHLKDVSHRKLPHLSYQGVGSLYFTRSPADILNHCLQPFKQLMSLWHWDPANSVLAHKCFFCKHHTLSSCFPG